jgi:tRNA(Arg) A34 adenosine deaminase TadA
MVSQQIFQQAIEVAKSSTSKKQVGALLLNRNRVVMAATNLENKSHPVQARFANKAGLREKIYLHAEIAALIKCKEQADSIVVARVNCFNDLRMAKPCPICQLALKEAGISKVYYSTNHGFKFFNLK